MRPQNETRTTSEPAPLIEAVVQGDLTALQERLAAGANPNTQKDQFGWTALMVAAYEGKIDAVRILLDSGARIGVKNTINQTALDIAVKADKTEIADLLRSRGSK